MILNHLNKDNLHHAYLIEGNKEAILPDILLFLQNIGIQKNNPDFFQITIDNLKIDEAFNLRSISSEKSFINSKKIFVINVNSFTLDAQNVLLKMFEEPIENTHFFVIVPDADVLLKTLLSRFYFISARQDPDKKSAENFLKMSIKNRIEFIKEFLTMPEEEDPAEDSARTKALNFINSLETELSKNVFGSKEKVSLFEHLFKVREFLRMSGSSPKTLLESLALIVPNF